MTFNTTSITGGSSLSNVTAKNIPSSQGLRADSANNLGYGLGRIARSAFEQIYQAYQRLWVSEPSPEENAMRMQLKIYRHGLRKCIQKLSTAIDNLHPHDPSKLAKIQSLVVQCATYLKPQENAEFQAFQKKALEPLKEKISKIAHPHIKTAVRQLLPVEEERSPHAKIKRAVQQTGGWPASFNLASLNGTNGFVVRGLFTGDHLGDSVSTAGDLNGDGKADLVFGAPGVSFDRGEVYVLFGQAGRWSASFNLATLNGTNGFVISSNAASGQLGISVSTAGDLNGDGRADLVLGAPFHFASFGEGAAYVLFGRAGGWPASFSFASLNGINGFAIPGTFIDDNLGISVSTAGDLNGDGKADLVLGAPGDSGNSRGAAYVLFGQAGGWPASFNLASLNGTNGFAISGIATNGNLGSSVSTAGDLNGDGKADLVLGAPGSINDGVAYVLFGKAGGWSASFNLASLNGTNGFAIPGIATFGRLGSAVGTAGDLNGDGKADLVLGAANVSSDDGVAYVIFGKASGWPASFNLATLNGTNGFAIPGIATNGYLGYSVSTAGDLNGDGMSDLVLGAEGVSFDDGAVYVIFGKAGGWSASFNLAALNGTNGFAISGIATRGRLGNAVGTAGDFNGDGRADLVLSAPYAYASSDGAAYLLFGQNALTIPTSPTPSSMTLSLSSMASSPTSIPSPSLTPVVTSSIAPLSTVTIVVNVPTNLNTTFVPLTAGILSLSNNTVTVRLVDGQGYAIVYTSNSSTVPLLTPFSPLEVTGFSIARGNATAGSAPVFEGCNAGGQCVLSNATTPLGEVFTTEGVDWKIVVPIVVSVAAVAIGGGLIFYFAYYRKKQQNKREITPSSTARLAPRVKK